MKIVSLYAVLLFSIFTINTSFAQTGLKKENIKVWGNCGMCKTNIEKAAKKGGATAATWNEETKILAVSYNTNKTSSEKIQTAIAKTGYDTESVSADTVAYTKLHGCCQYDRKTASVSVEAGKSISKIIYTCPMHADIKEEKAGKCTKCGMDLKEKN